MVNKFTQEIHHFANSVEKATLSSQDANFTNRGHCKTVSVLDSDLTGQIEDD
jgi:hypothetical protein